MEPEEKVAMAYSEVGVEVIFMTEFRSLSDSFSKLALSLKRIMLLQLPLKSDVEVVHEHVQLSLDKESGPLSNDADFSSSRG
eukprot:XP_001706239.1 Hypothetical protein GL50803_22776 [Giardia lamblia ATCC 50803]